MNRELKFRMRKAIGKGFTYLELGKNDPEPYLKGTEQQFTGLKDRNGVDIYEGDIVQFDFGKDTKEGIINSLVVFSQGMFCYNAGKSKQVLRGSEWKHPHDYVHSGWWDYKNYPLHKGFYGKGSINENNYKESNITVIGNIYENPELLT